MKARLTLLALLQLADSLPTPPQDHLGAHVDLVPLPIREVLGVLPALQRVVVSGGGARPTTVEGRRLRRREVGLADLPQQPLQIG